MSYPETQPKKDVKWRLEFACNLVVSSTPDAHIEGMMASILGYRDFIQQNLRSAGAVDGPTFVTWMESATRNTMDYPEPWGAELIRLFDQVMIDVVRDENMQPGTVAEALDEWAEETAEEVREIHNLPEGYFDV